MPATKPPKPPQPAEAAPARVADAQMTSAPTTLPRAAPVDERLRGRVAIVTGADAGLGRAIAARFAAEGCDLAIVVDALGGPADETRALVEGAGRRCLVLACDVGDEQACREAVLRTLNAYERLDALVNAELERWPQDDLLHVSEDQLARTFRTAVFASVFMAKACLKHLDRGAAIVNTASLSAYRGDARLIDYSAAAGAVVAFTRSLALSLRSRGVRVNAVAPAALNETPASLAEALAPAAAAPAVGPDEVAACYAFLASAEATAITGQVLHPNGGEIVNG